MTAPVLSFIVLSYDYQDYIGVTIRSILDQTIGDFEVIVVDDASTDLSRDVVRAFDDPRVRLLVNENNLGGAGSYNVAVNAARGTWLVNLDADDWIAPEKCAVQLAAVADDPRLDIVGTWIRAAGADGARHPRAATLEAPINRDHDLNLIETWIGQNPLCRSSTMVRRSAHLAIGLDDPTMVRAPDYELWTRALAAGLRFGLVREPLTFYRFHAHGLTQADPAGTVRELGYAMARNLVPLAERQSAFNAHEQMVRWMATHPRLDLFSGDEASRMVGALISFPPPPDFARFRDGLLAPEPNPILERPGRFAMVAARASVPASIVEKLSADVRAYCEARDYWKERYDNSEKAYRESIEKLNADVRAYCEARDYWKERYDNSEKAYREIIEELNAELHACREKCARFRAGYELWTDMVEGRGSGANQLSRMTALEIAARMLRRASLPSFRASRKPRAGSME